jgi:hypothetical protein
MRLSCVSVTVRQHPQFQDQPDQFIPPVSAIPHKDGRIVYLHFILSGFFITVKGIFCSFSSFPLRLFQNLVRGISLFLCGIVQSEAENPG